MHPVRAGLWLGLCVPVLLAGTAAASRLRVELDDAVPEGSEPLLEGHAPPGSQVAYAVTAHIHVSEANLCLGPFRAYWMLKQSVGPASVDFDPAEALLALENESMPHVPASALLGGHANWTVRVLATLAESAPANAPADFTASIQVHPETSTGGCPVDAASAVAFFPLVVSYEPGFAARLVPEASAGARDVRVHVRNEANGASQFCFRFGHANGSFDACRFPARLKVMEEREFVFPGWAAPHDWDGRILVLQRSAEAGPGALDGEEFELQVPPDHPARAASRLDPQETPGFTMLPILGASGLVVALRRRPAAKDSTISRARL